MKFATLIAAACAGALMALAMPVNPVQVAFDYGQHRIRTPATPGGFHSAPVTVAPNAPPPPLKLDLGQSLQTQAELQIQQSDRRRQDIQAYRHNPP